MRFATPSKHPQKQFSFISPRLLTGLALIAAISAPAVAATLCVKPGGKAGCFSTIGAAVAAASPGSTNGADVGDTPTPGPTGINLNSGGGGTPITGTVISGNQIDDETDDVAINTPARVDLHFNNLLGGETGVDNLGPGTINATLNYWGCFDGPGAKKCSTVSGPGVDFIPFLRTRVP